METTTVYIGDEPLEEVDEQVKTLLSTVAGTIPLDRGLGIDDSFIDKPTEAAQSLYVAEVVEKIPRYIPTLSVDSVNFTAAAKYGIIRVPEVFDITVIILRKDKLEHYFYQLQIILPSYFPLP